MTEFRLIEARGDLCLMRQVAPGQWVLVASVGKMLALAKRKPENALSEKEAERIFG